MQHLLRLHLNNQKIILCMSARVIIRQWFCMPEKQLHACQTAALEN